MEAYLLKGGNLAFVVVWRDVVDSDTPVSGLKILIGKGRDTLVCAVTGLEVQN